jgi:hypothetical protein
VTAQGRLRQKLFHLAVTYDLLLNFEPALTRDDDLWSTVKSTVWYQYKTGGGQPVIGNIRICTMMLVFLMADKAWIPRE